MGWEEPLLGQDLQPGLSHQHLAGAGSDPAPGVLGSHGLWMGFSSHAKGHRVLGANISVLPPLHCDSGASPPSPWGQHSVPSVVEAAAFPDFVLDVYGVSVYSRF